MNVTTTFSKPVHVQDYFRGWEKAQQEYQRQLKDKPKKTVGFRAKKVSMIVSCLLLLLCGFQRNASAQNLYQTIRGKVLDRESQMPLIGVSVAVISMNPVKGVVTDADGNFKIEKVPVGRHTLKFNYIGYEEQTLPELLLGSGKELVLTVGLSENIRQMQEVVIKAQQEKGRPENEMATLSARSISVEETKHYAAAMNDPARAAQNFAGVGATDDMSNEIVVRGNSPKGVLWRIEGIEVPNPTHFAQEGASGGPISMLSVNMIDNSDFYTGAFPTEYGNALSGIFDMKLRKGNNEKREYAFQAGVLGVDFAAEGPFKKGYKGSYLVNYRYSTLAILNKLGFKVAGDNAPDFQDLSFKLNLPTEKAGTFILWGLGGLSKDAQEAEKDASKWQEKSDAFNNIYKGGMGTVGLSHTYFVNPHAYLETILSYARNQSAFTYDSLMPDMKPYMVYRENYEKTAARASVLYNHKLNAQNTIRLGMIYSKLGFDMLSEGRNEEDALQTFVKNSGNTGLTQFYGQWKYRLLDNVTLNSGLHFMRFGLNGSTSLEPRLGLRWNLSSAQAIGFGFGMHSRHESTAAYFAQQPSDGTYSQANQNLELTKARHFVISYDLMLREDLRLKAETYYQQLYDVAVAADPNSPFALLNTQEGLITDSLVSKGTGKNYGLELSLEKFFTNNYYFLATTSLYNSKYGALDGIERNTRFNGNYIFNVLGGKEFKVGKAKNNVIGLNMKLVWAGGNRYTPVDLERSQMEGNEVLADSETFERRLPAYFRTDLRVSYRKNKPKASYIVSLDIQNVSNRQNLYRQYFDSETNSVETAYQMGLLPVLNYRIEF